MVSADPSARGRLAFGLLVVALAAVFAGLLGLGVIGYWYAADMGWTGSGSTIVVSRAPIIAAALVPAASSLVGSVTLLLRDEIPARSTAGVALVVANVLMAGSVWFGVDAYPQVQQAELIAIASDGTVRWQVELPVTEVFGLRSETERTVTLEGRADRRACDWRHRSVTLDRSSGEILEVEAIPAHGPSEVPPPPTPIETRRGGFDVEQGSTPFVCRS